MVWKVSIGGNESLESVILIEDIKILLVFIITNREERIPKIHVKAQGIMSVIIDLAGLSMP